MAKNASQNSVLCEARRGLSSQDWPPGLQRIHEGRFGLKGGENVHFNLRGSAS